MDPEFTGDSNSHLQQHPPLPQSSTASVIPPLPESRSSSMVTIRQQHSQLPRDYLLNQFTLNVKKYWAEKLESMIENYLILFESNNDPQIIFIVSSLLASWFHEIPQTNDLRRNRINYVFNQLLLRTDGKTANIDIFNRWLIYKLMANMNIKLDAVKWSTINLQITLRQEEIGRELLNLIESLNSIDGDQLTILIRNIVKVNPWFGELTVNNLKCYPFLKIRTNIDPEGHFNRKDANNFGPVIVQCLEESIDRSDYGSVYKLINIIPDDQLDCNEIFTCMKRLIHSILTHDYEILDLDQFYAAIIGRSTNKMAKLVSKIDWRLRKQGDLFSTKTDTRINSSTYDESTSSPPFIAINQEMSKLSSSSLKEVPLSKPIETEVSPIYHNKKMSRLSNTSDSTNRSINESPEEKMINIILDHETKEWNVDNCFLLATIDRKHFLLETLSAPLSHFHVIPDELKLLFLLEMLYNLPNTLLSDEGQRNESTKVNKAFTELRELVNSFWFNSLIESKPILSFVKAKLEWIFKCIDWCLKIDSNLKYYRKLYTIFKMLSQGASPLAVFNKFKILNAALDSGDNDVNQEVLNLLSESGHQSELMIWYGYLAVKLTCLWVFNNNTTEEETIPDPNQISSLINKILPLSFRVEVLENLFSLLFLTQRDIVESSDSNEYFHDIPNESDFTQTKSDIGLNTTTTSTFNEIASHLTATSAESSSLHADLSSSSSSSCKPPSTFVFPNDLIPDFLNVLKDCGLKAQASLFAFKRRLGDTKNEVSEKGLDDVFVESSIIGYDECKTRLRSLMDYINDSQWRYSVIEPAIVEQRLSSSMQGKNTNNNTVDYNNTNSEKNPGNRDEGKDDYDASIFVNKGDDNEEKLLLENNEPVEGLRDLLSGNSNREDNKKDEIFSSLIPCMLASPDQLLRYCLIENQIDRAKQVYKLFKESLINTEEAYELLIIEKTAELSSRCRKIVKTYLKHPSASKSPEATSPRTMKVTQMQKLLSEFMSIMDFNTNGKVDTNRLLIDYSICSSSSLELSEIILENCFQAKNLDAKSDPEEKMDEFINRTTSLLLLFKDSESLRSTNLATLFSLYPDANLFNAPKVLMAEKGRISSIKRYLNDLRSLLISDPIDPTTLSSPVLDSRPLTIQYQKLISCFPSGKFNYLKALFYHVRKVSEALNEARKRSENLARVPVSADKSPMNPLTKQGNYFSVLYKSPSAILCSLVIKYGISPKVVDDLARDMKVDLLGTLCSVTCPQIPTTTKNDDSSCDFTLIDSFHPALCELIQCYLTGSHSMENSVLIQNHFDDERTTLEEGETSIIKNQELINYFRHKSWILVSLLKLLGLISMENGNFQDKEITSPSNSSSSSSAYSSSILCSSDQILNSQSPLQKWISMVKTTIGTNSREDPISLTALALHPRIPVHNSLVMRALEKCAINHDYIQIHRMLQLLDLRNANSSLEALWTALLLKLTKETNDVKYALQMSCTRTMRDLVVDLIFNSTSYSDTNSAERALKSAISRAEIQSESHLVLDSLRSALDTVNIYAKIATLSGLKSWKDAYNNLSEVDILTILKSKKCYSLTAAWNDTMRKNKQSAAFSNIFPSSSSLSSATATPSTMSTPTPSNITSVVDAELDFEVESLRYELLLLAFCEKSSKSSQVTPPSSLPPSHPIENRAPMHRPSFSSIKSPIKRFKSSIHSLGTIISAIDGLGLDSVKLIEKILPAVDNWESKETLVKHLLADTLIRHKPDKVEHYNNYLLGISLIKTIRPEMRIHYEQLTTKPFLIVEQMFMNLEYEAIEKVIRSQKLIKCDHLIEIYARKAVEIEIESADSVTGSETTLISSSILTESNTTNLNVTSFSSSSSPFKMPVNVPSKEQWIPDYKVNICMLCKMEKFSMFNRKHHCRRCGRVVCGICSQKFLLIPEISTRQPVRVCDDCNSQTRLESTSSTPSNRKTSTSSSTSSNGGEPTVEWILSLNEHENETIRDEFYYESAPSSSLCLSLLKLHSDKKQCAKVIIEQLSRPLFEILSYNRVDYGLIIDLIKSLLLSAKVLINDEESKLIIDIDFLLSRVDIVKMLVEGNCPHRDLIGYVISKDDASYRLQEKLIEMERFDLAYHVATKYGRVLKEIWKTWAMVCLRHCQFTEARKKFKSCFGFKSTNNTSDINSKLLQEIFDVFDTIKEKVNQLSLRERCKAIKSGQIVSIGRQTRIPNPDEGHLPQILIEEGLYYLENYGSKEDELRFYVRFGLLRNAVLLILSETNQSVFSNLFVTKLLLPCTQTGSFKKLLATFNSIDPTLTRSWKYWIYACKYLSTNNFYHILHGVQVFMGDYIRAAMTQINFFVFPKVTDYSQLIGRLEHLTLAKQHCQDFLVNKGQVNKGCLSFSSQEVTSQIKVINLQIEITNKLFAKKTKLPIALVDISEEKETTYLKEIRKSNRSSPTTSSATISNGSNNQLTVPTLLEDNIVAKTQLAVLVLLELGSTISEGLEIAQQIIKGHGLDAGHVYRLAGKVLAQSNKVNLVQLINQLTDCIRLSHEPSESVALCDDLLVTAVRHIAEPQLADQLIKMMSNDLIKINAYILTDKLKSAYLLAVRLHRVDDVRRIHDASIRTKQDNLTKICQLWLDKNS